MSILVTGGAGYIGSHTCLQLLNNHHHIYVLDSFINSTPISLKRISGLVSKDINVDENCTFFMVISEKNLILKKYLKQF